MRSIALFVGIIAIQRIETSSLSVIEYITLANRLPRDLEITFRHTLEEFPIESSLIDEETKMKSDCPIPSDQFNSENFLYSHSAE